MPVNEETYARNAKKHLAIAIADHKREHKKDITFSEVISNLDLRQKGENTRFFDILSPREAGVARKLVMAVVDSDDKRQEKLKKKFSVSHIHDKKDKEAAEKSGDGHRTGSEESASSESQEQSSDSQQEELEPKVQK